MIERETKKRKEKNAVKEKKNEKTEEKRMS